MVWCTPRKASEEETKNPPIFPPVVEFAVKKVYRLSPLGVTQTEPVLVFVADILWRIFQRQLIWHCVCLHLEKWSQEKAGGNLTGRKLNEGYPNMASNLLNYTTDGNKITPTFSQEKYIHIILHKYVLEWG